LPELRHRLSSDRAALGAREGRVRCGRCDTLFDAIATLARTPRRVRLPKDRTSYHRQHGLLLGTEKDRSFDFGPPPPHPLLVCGGRRLLLLLGCCCRRLR